MIIDNQQLSLKRKVQRLSLVRGVQYKRLVLDVYKRQVIGAGLALDQIDVLRKIEKAER